MLKARGINRLLLKYSPLSNKLLERCCVESSFTLQGEARVRLQHRLRFTCSNSNPANTHPAFRRLATSVVYL